MDAFGIGAGIAGAARIYSHSARQTGRTTAMLDAAKDGDRILCLNAKEADRLRRLLRDRGLEVEVIVVPTRDPGAAFSRGTPTGRSIFDHSWVEQHYMEAIERARKDIDHLQTELSGWGAAHEKTRAQAAEIMKWEV